jgi:hypothetical protein
MMMMMMMRLKIFLIHYIKVQEKENRRKNFQTKIKFESIFYYFFLNQLKVCDIGFN